MKNRLDVKFTSGHLLSEECDHLGEVDWSRCLSNLGRREFMAKLLSAERQRKMSKRQFSKTHHVVGLAIADWPTNSLEHLFIKNILL